MFGLHVAVEAGALLGPVVTVAARVVALIRVDELVLRRGEPVLEAFATHLTREWS